MIAVTFGEALIDEFPEGRTVAGAPLHVAAHLVTLGWESHLVSRVGRDPDGEWILQTLTRHRIASDLVETDDALATGTVTVLFEGTAHRFSISRPAAWDAIAGPDRLPAHDVFVFGSLGGRDERSRSTLLRLLAQNTAKMTVFDANLRPPDVDRAVIEAGIAAATLMKTNHDEFTDIAGMLGFAPLPGSFFDVGSALEWLCVTRGKEGAELFHRRGQTWRVGGVAVPVVDTVGAGDAFTAGIVDGLARGYPPDRALTAARRLATETVGRRGGLPGVDVDP